MEMYSISRLPKKLFEFLMRVPEEILEKIFVTLPAEYLVTFRSVCKSWESLITDISFVKRHLCRSLEMAKKSSYTTLLLGACCKQGSICAKRSLWLAEICSKDDNLVLVLDTRDLAQNFEIFQALHRRTDFQVVHSNGIICLSAHRSDSADIVLLNPILGEINHIYPWDVASNQDICKIGFGYDSRSENYKVFVVTCWGATFRAYLYTLQADEWKEIAFELGIRCDGKGVYCEGVYYWVSMLAEEDWKINVLAFDMTEEKFHSIQTPAFEDARIALWKETVVIFDLCLDQRYIDMWVMSGKRGGAHGETSWNKLITIVTTEDMKSPIGFWKDDELIIECKKDDSFHIISYNLSTKKLSPIHIDSKAYQNSVFQNSHRVNSFVGSLVSIKRKT